MVPGVRFKPALVNTDKYTLKWVFLECLKISGKLKMSNEKFRKKQNENKHIYKYFTSLKKERNWVFATISNFVISYLWQTDISNRIDSMKYQNFLRWDCKDQKIRVWCKKSVPSDKNEKNYVKFKNILWTNFYYFKLETNEKDENLGKCS